MNSTSLLKFLSLALARYELETHRLHVAALLNSKSNLYLKGVSKMSEYIS